MKKRILISSVLTIVLCFSLIVGSTFALFTDVETFDITVTSGKVDIEAEIGDLLLFSAQLNDGVTIDDINNVNESDYTLVWQRQDVGNFANGGTANVDANGIVTVERMTPGDMVAIPVSFTNFSDVAIQYRYKIVKLTDSILNDVMMVGIDDGTETAAEGYVSRWFELDAQGDVDPVNLVIELPVTVGNTNANGVSYHGKSAKYQIIVEAVQANGVSN